MPQGLTLAQPEVVPFRLTQNMIDCYGVSGIEGVFRRTAEITLQAWRPSPLYAAGMASGLLSSAHLLTAAYAGLAKRQT